MVPKKANELLKFNTAERERERGCWNSARHGKSFNVHDKLECSGLGMDTRGNIETKRKIDRKSMDNKNKSEKRNAFFVYFIRRNWCTIFVV